MHLRDIAELPLKSVGRVQCRPLHSAEDQFSLIKPMRKTMPVMVGPPKDPSALCWWMVAGLEVARVIGEFENVELHWNERDGQTVSALLTMVAF